MKTGSEFHVGIIGLGSIGMGVALSCVRVGLSTWGADLDSNAYATLKEAGACGVSNNVVTFAEGLGTLLVLVVNATQVKQMLFGEKGVAQYLKPGTAVTASSTIASADTQGITTTLAGFGLETLDTPVSGGAVKAVNGETTVMVSGSDVASERLAPVLEAVAGKVYCIGLGPGLGSAIEIIHQLLMGIHITVGAEAMALTVRTGISLDVMYGVVTNVAGNSWVFENRMHHVMDGDYTPHSVVDIFIKDLDLVTDTAKALRFPLPLASTALDIFTSVGNMGYGKEGDNVVIRIFSGIALPGARL